MKQKIVPGASLDVLTAGEARELLEHRFAQTVEERVRAPAVVALDAAGGGTDEVFTVPAGFEFEVRRVTLDLDSAAGPNDGNVPLNVAGRAVEYLRSGSRIEYANPSSPANVPSVPGVQSWGEEQGPYLRNGETFEVRARNLTANSRLYALVEGVLRRPPAQRDHGAGRGNGRR